MILKRQEILISLMLLKGNFGFSIGISDVTPGENLKKQKDALIDQAYQESLNLIAKSRAGKLENLAGCDAEQVCSIICIHNAFFLIINFLLFTDSRSHSVGSPIKSPKYCWWYL